MDAKSIVREIHVHKPRVDGKCLLEVMSTEGCQDLFLGGRGWFKWRSIRIVFVDLGLCKRLVVGVDPVLRFDTTISCAESVESNIEDADEAVLLES